MGPVAPSPPPWELPNPLLGPICVFCSQVVSLTGLESHYSRQHTDLTFRCSVATCTRQFTSLVEADDHLLERHREVPGPRFCEGGGLLPGWGASWCHTSPSQRLSLLVLPGTLEYQATRGVNYGAWARVRCKGCPYTGIGLQEGRAHLERHHPGDEGLVNLNIFCRVCADSIANYEDEEELGEHLEAAHSTVMAALRATLTPTLTS